MKNKYEIKPTEGNVNLMISINEIEGFLQMMLPSNQAYTIRSMKKIGKLTYEISKDFGNEYVKLYESDLFALLNATKGLYALEKECDGITKDSKFRIELKKGKLNWVIDNGN